MTTDTQKIIRECKRRGIMLEPRGQNLVVTPKENTTPKIVEQLRRHKYDIIASLEATQLATQVHVAKQVLAGEFEGADEPARAALTIGLHGVLHPQCQHALAHLKMETTKD